MRWSRDEIGDESREGIKEGSRDRITGESRSGIRMGRRDRESRA